VTSLDPIYTERTECQDCYKCIRECPVKAIKVEEGYASIIAELCIYCGRCVEMCPHGAKKVRSDRGRVAALLAASAKIVVSLAPSWASDFPELPAEKLVAALRLLGFFGVSETALGAEQVSAHVAGLIHERPQMTWLSSACPVVVEYVERYQPDAVGLLTPLLSPLLAHARLLKRELGEDTRVVFIGPCIAKKREADLHPGLVDAALTFADLRAWLKEAGIALAEVEPAAEDRFIPRGAREGGRYPIGGGMVAGIQASCPDTDFMAFSGFAGVERALAGLDEAAGPAGAFLELLACDGGCVNGPKSRRGGTAAKSRHIIRRSSAAPAIPEPLVEIGNAYQPHPVPVFECTEAQVREALRSVGKLTTDDELNCGGCGYDSCRDFARGLAIRRAERQMCVSYMRKLAQKKTHVLMQKMPSAVVIADEQLRVVECNPRFAEFFAPAGQGAESMAGAALATLVPFYSLFRRVLATGEEILDREIRFRGRVFNASVFGIEKESLVGGIFRDATQPAVEKEQIIRRAREVIQKNLLTVQQIAYLIGENAAESEMALNAIVRSFTPGGAESGD
jgi:iron only hydrogenase large subunit-like protein